MIHRRPRPPQNIHNRLFVDILAKKRLQSGAGTASTVCRGLEDERYL